MELLSKICSKCKSEKPLSEFYRDKRKSDGLYSKCKVCQRETNNKSRIKRKEYNLFLTKDIKSYFTCNKCQKIMPLRYFSINIDAREGISYTCRECQKAIRKKVREDNKIKLKQPGTKVCYTCKIEKNKSDFYKNCSKKDYLNSNCKECHTRKTLELKIETLLNYGGLECICCNDEDIAVLCIDHIFNNGVEDRKINFSGRDFYRKMRKLGFPLKDQYQVLCCSCNWAKHWNGGVLPEWRKGINKKWKIREAEQALCLGI